MKIYIACSKHFYYKVNEIKKQLEKLGHKIILPNSFKKPFKEEEMKKLGIKEHVKFKRKMMKHQEQKIKKSDAVLVLNLKKNNIPNYIGGATFMEVVKAWELKKKIFFYNPLPKCSFTDELIGISPTIINKDLSLIK